MNTVNLSRQTALHAAVETGNIKVGFLSNTFSNPDKFQLFQVVQFLLEHGVETARKDVFGRTALDLAQELNRKEIATMIERQLANIIE